MIKEKVQIKRFDKSLPLPSYQTVGAAGFDLSVRKTTIIKSGQIGYVPLNIAVKPPKGYFFLLTSRSSTHKRGLLLANGVGVGDPDYCGDSDEYLAAFLNFSKKPVIIKKGERLAQGLFVKFIRVKLEEVTKMRNRTRGGFGSTGNR